MNNGDLDIFLLYMCVVAVTVVMIINNATRFGMMGSPWDIAKDLNEYRVRDLEYKISH